MARWRGVSSGIFFLLVVLPAAASSEMWLCSPPTGDAIYTNIPKDYQDCAAFEPKSELGMFSTNVVPTSPRLEEFRSPLEPMPASLPPKAEEALPYREMPFEVYRMLSLGMSEAEILKRAGPPSYVVPNTTGAFGLLAPISSASRYYYLGDWIVTVTFDLSGRVINLDRSRPSP
jgi:hypothetical protein